MPNMPNTETSFAELKARLAKTIDFAKAFKPAQIDGTEDKDITLKLGTNERKFTGQALLLNFILPNFYFHCTTAYDLLRHCGVELAKRDFMSTPVEPLGQEFERTPLPPYATAAPPPSDIAGRRSAPPAAAAP